MESRAKLFGHSIHQMLIVFPLGLLGGSVIFDIAYLISGAAHWAEIAFWMVTVGVIAGLIAAVFGLIDWLAIPARTRAKYVGIWHALTNVTVVGLFIAGWFLRRPDIHAPPLIAMILSFVGVALAVVGGWLGGELVDRLGVGVDDGANLNAPSSLRYHKATVPVASRTSVL
jgi:uncharacterized membrane protein